MKALASHQCVVPDMNVLTLYQTGKLAQVIKEMQSYKIKLLGMSERRWTGSGSRQLLSGHHILYSGRADDHHSRGVGIITTKEVHKSLLEWKPISERIIKPRYNSAFAKLSVILSRHHCPRDPMRLPSACATYVNN